jgi:hypothetical protein
MKGSRILELSTVVLIICVLCPCLGFIAPLDAIFQLVAGWALFLARVLPEVRISWVATLTAVVCLTALAIGLHLFLRWLYRLIREGSLVGEASRPRPWQRRWTGMILALVVLMFVAGISAVGITHQTVWLLTAPEQIVQRSGDTGVRMVSQNNLRQIGVAAHNYHEHAHGTLPPGGTFDARGNALHGWQTFLLPYIEQEKLFRRIDLTLPWWHSRNAAPLGTVVKLYLQPGVREPTEEEGYALSHYAANVRVMGGGKPRTFDSISDGLSNTILAGEVWTHYRPWGHPTNWRDPGHGIHTTADSFGTARNNDTTIFLLADGSTRTVSRKVSTAVLRALSTPDGGEHIDPGEW